MMRPKRGLLVRSQSLKNQPQSIHCPNELRQALKRRFPCVVLRQEDRAVGRVAQRCGAVWRWRSGAPARFIASPAASCEDCACIACAERLARNATLVEPLPQWPAPGCVLAPGPLCQALVGFAVSREPRSPPLCRKKAIFRHGCGTLSVVKPGG
jgi:hypothetical protein